MQISVAGLPQTASSIADTENRSGSKKGLHEAASEFESLLIGQMLKSARADSQGWFGTGEDQTSAALIDMAEEQVARALSQAGGLGLAQMVETQMAANPGAAIAATPKLP